MARSEVEAPRAVLWDLDGTLADAPVRGTEAKSLAIGFPREEGGNSQPEIGEPPGQATQIAPRWLGQVQLHPFVPPFFQKGEETADFVVRSEGGQRVDKDVAVAKHSVFPIFRRKAGTVRCTCFPALRIAFFCDKRGAIGWRYGLR